MYIDIAQNGSFLYFTIIERKQTTATAQHQGEKWQNHKYINENTETTTPPHMSSLTMPLER
jgi:hypothetical protein